MNRREMLLAAPDPEPAQIDVRKVRVAIGWLKGCAARSVLSPDYISSGTARLLAGVCEAYLAAVTPPPEPAAPEQKTYWLIEWTYKGAPGSWQKFDTLEGAESNFMSMARNPEIYSDLKLSGRHVQKPTDKEIEVWHVEWADGDIPHIDDPYLSRDMAERAAIMRRAELRGSSIRVTGPHKHRVQA